MTIGVEYDGAARAYPARCLLKVVEKNKYRVWNHDYFNQE